jgi:hypothetical protein
MKQKKGVAAMITVVVLGALMIMVGGVMMLSSITEGQATLMETKTKKKQGVLDACAEESLLKLGTNGTLPSTIITTLGSCGVTLNSQVGTSWDYLLIGSNGETSAVGINLVLDRGPSLAVSSWVDQ